MKNSKFNQKLQEIADRKQPRIFPKPEAPDIQIGIRRQMEAFDKKAHAAKTDRYFTQLAQDQKADRATQHGRYLDAGPLNWDDRDNND
jgi:hypothetical protein